MFADFSPTSTPPPDTPKGVDNQPLIVKQVGITGLEPATSRPPDVCATNCAKSRCFVMQR